MLNYKRTRILFIRVFIVLLQLGVSWGYLLAVPVTFSILAFIMSFPIQANFYIKAYRKAAVEKTNTIALSFDDGPHEQTNDILKVLAQHQLKAAFFVVGKNAEKKPEIIKAIDTAGHIIGNHSYSHHTAFPFWRPKLIAADIAKCNAVIKELTGKNMQWFRPPVGVTNPMVAKAIALSGMETIAWSLRSFDTQLKTAKLQRRLARKIKAGKLLLLHDSTSDIVQIIEYIVELARKKGIKIVPVDELLNIKAYSHE